MSRIHYAYTVSLVLAAVGFWAFAVAVPWSWAERIRSGIYRVVAAAFPAEAPRVILERREHPIRVLGLPAARAFIARRLERRADKRAHAPLFSGAVWA